ncbi:MAG TPA: hypothetical protein VJW20_07230 [Candidatus Angelobacter sp.]|nr:hypothetical protein [Candidatus Angelobacter sp.]
MIDWLQASQSAYFFKRKANLPKKEIAKAFKDIRDAADTSTNRNVFRHVKEPLGQAHWSAICFYFERTPSFLHDLPDDYMKERICGFILLVEYRDHAVLFKSHLDFPAEFKTKYLQRIGGDKLESAIAQEDVIFEQVDLRNMTISKHAVKKKRIEAYNLANVMSLAGANRFVASTFRVRNAGQRVTATPSTGKIATRSDRSGYEQMVQYSIQYIDRFLDDNNGAPLAPFIQSFARSITLESMTPTLQPRYIAVDVGSLEESIFDESEGIRLVHGNEEEAEALIKDEIDVVVAALDKNFNIQKVRDEYRVIDPDDQQKVGEIKISKSRISLRHLDIPQIDNIYVEQKNLPDDADRVTLKRYIDHEDLITVLFSDLSIVYLKGQLYKDNALANGEALLRHIKTNAALNGAIDEKGQFAAGQTEFDANSIFGVIVNNIRENGEILICDDLGDEWADFLGVNNTVRPNTFSFYHAKHGEAGLGASPLHDLVSQASKNLGRMNPKPEDIERKLPSWEQPYRSGGVETAIQRVIGIDPAMLAETVNQAIAMPDTIGRVYIVTTLLSRNQLVEAFAEIQRGQSPTPHFVQLYWLLTSFIGTCKEFGAYPYIICRE